MKARIIKIGNSHGIRIPKALLEQTGLRGDVDIDMKGDSLIIKPARMPRAGWAEKLGEMGLRGDDHLLDSPEESTTRFDDEEWQWP